MTRSVKDIDAISVIIELENRGSYGNTSFLLYFHPVGNGVLCGLLTLYGTGEIDCTAVEKKLLGKCCFTGIRVGDDGKSTSFSYFIF